MAGTYWHFYTANRAIELLEDRFAKSTKTKCILDYRSEFLAGVQGPDFNFYPGGDGEISSVAHGDQPADLGRSLLKFASTDKDRAFAYGWLMHLTTDNITHPLVNRLILNHFPRQTRNGADPKLYPLGHHRVEWGIDVDLLQTDKIVPYLPELKETLSSALELAPVMNKALNNVFDYTLTPEIWQGSIKGMIKFITLFNHAWRLTGRITDTNSFKQSLKTLGYFAVINPLAKIIALRNPENGAGVFIPIKPTKVEIQAIQEHSERVYPAFEEYIQNNFEDLPNDTG